MEDQIEDLDSPEEISEFTGEIPVHGIIAPEGVPTGDGRMFAKGALTQRDLPVPLKYEYVSSHGSDTSHATTVGTVDKIWRDEEGLIWWSGRVAVMKPYSDEVLAGIADGSIRGVSIDGDDSTSRVMKMGVEGLSQEVTVFDSIRTSALTVVSIPAFQEAYIDFGANPEEAVVASAALKDCGCGGSFTAMRDTPGPDEALPAPEDRAGALITLLPEPGSSVNEASSEDEAHLTFIWMGDVKDAEWDFEALEEAVRAYAAEATPITVPVKERGLLGDEDADVLFLEPTESLVAFRDGLLANETVRAAHDAAEQYPDWTPHVTLGYPQGVENGPARAGFADDAITFDRISLWVGSQRLEYPMGTPEVEEQEFANGGMVASGELTLVGEVGQESFAPGTKDGPGWVTHPKETSRIRHYWVSGKGAAKIRWGAPGDFNRCRMQLSKYVQNMDWLAGLCANMHKEAIGSWPGRERGARGSVTASASSFDTAAPLVSLTAAAAWTDEPVFNAEFFQNPNLSGPTQMRVDTKTGRVWGHIAAWGVCHVGFENECVLAPRSATNYASFKHGIVDTTAGEMRVAKLTYGIGHPNKFLNAQRARAHYNRTDAVRAYVNVGEDSHGIWFSGVLAPGLSQREINEFRAVGSLSGDWRLVGGSLEMIAAVAVSTPGFPIPQTEFASGKQVSLVSAGVILESDSVSSENKEERLSQLKDGLRSFTIKSVSDIIRRTDTHKE